MNSEPRKKSRMMDIMPKRSVVRKEDEHDRRKEDLLRSIVERKPLAKPEQHPKPKLESRYEIREREVRYEPQRPTWPMQRRAATEEPQVIEEPKGPRIIGMHAGEEDVTTTERNIGYPQPTIPADRGERSIPYVEKEVLSKEEQRIIARVQRREQETEGRPVRRGRSLVFWVVIAVVLGVGAYAAVKVLPRAEITLVAKKIEWSYSADGASGNAIGLNNKIADVDVANRQIPIATIPVKKSSSFSFAASGSGKGIQRKASGKVVVYNAFGPVAQPLVAGTRLQSPDGKVFRLKDRIVVPAMQGKEPGSVEADVVADVAGEAYNIGPVEKFIIPGFAGTPKAAGFYATSKEAMTGGFVGEGKYPTADDIKAAKESAEKKMQDAVDAELSAQMVQGLQVIAGSKKIAIAKEAVNEGVDEQGNFSVYIEAEGSIDAFKEEHVLKLMTALAQQVNGEGYEIKEKQLSYGDMTTDPKTGAIALPVTFKGTFWKPVDLNGFKNKIMGKKVADIRSIVTSANIENAEVVSWPFYVQSIPSDHAKVKIGIR